jgi:hypothetical protein
MTVSDDGVGIFEKIKEVFGYTPEEAALELTKGKLTTDPKRHSGEGIFFTSRVFDRFSLVSDTRVFTHNRSSSDWQIEQENRIVKGTFVCLELLISSGRTMQQMFDEFSSGPDDYIFSKTSVPLKLALFGNENLNSRSQAKRVLARVDRFDEVCLDFAEVEHIGQGFADEIFRVFRNEKPHVNIVPLNASTQVVKMIRRAQHSFDVQSDA